MVTLDFGKVKWVYGTGYDRDGSLRASNLAKVKHASHMVNVLRNNNDVIVNGIRGIHVVPADTIVRGFGEGKDGKSLRQLLKNNALYDYFLEPVVA